MISVPKLTDREARVTEITGDTIGQQELVR